MGEFASDDLLISAGDTERLPEETDKTVETAPYCPLPKVANSLCVTQASIMSHCAFRAAFPSSHRQNTELSEPFILY